jgi:hypothetical protein
MQVGTSWLPKKQIQAAYPEAMERLKGTVGSAVGEYLLKFGQSSPALPNAVGSKNSDELKVPRFTRLKVRLISPSQPLDFNCRRRKLADFRR